MRLEALVLIEDDKEAQKLVVTWPSVHAASDDAIDAEWARISGVDIDDLERIAPVLFQNEILGPAGFVDEDAIRFIKSQIAAILTRS